MEHLYSAVNEWNAACLSVSSAPACVNHGQVRQLTTISPRKPFNFARTTHYTAHKIGYGTLPMTPADEQQSNHDVRRGLWYRLGSHHNGRTRWCFALESTVKKRSEWRVCCGERLSCGVVHAKNKDITLSPQQRRLGLLFH